MRELQDLYDINRKPTGEQIYRGDAIPEGRYRLGVQVWVRNADGKFLLSQRHPGKKKPLKWEATGGAVSAGEDTLSAAVREVGEEIGLHFSKESLVPLGTKFCDETEFLDIYMVEWNGGVDELRLQEDEVVDAKWVTYEEMEIMDACGELACEYRDLFGTVKDVSAEIYSMGIEDYVQEERMMAEYWDPYDSERRLTGEIHRRGDAIPDGRYHLVVQIWVRDDADRFLISRRHPDKPFGLYWECTGGSVTRGEDSITGALREVEEELGIRLDPGSLTLFKTERRDQYHDFVDNYTARWSGALSELHLQVTEVVDARWVTYDELCAIDDAGELVPTLKYFREAFVPGK